MDNVQNMTAMVTGGAAGLGYKYSEILLRHGARSVAIIDLQTSNGEDAAAALEKEFGKGRVIFVVCDVTKAEELEKAFKTVINAFHGLDILINNAGILDDTRWEQTLDINVKALIRSSLLALDHMAKHKGGKGGVIVNVASILGLTTTGALPVYCSSKHAVIGFTRALTESYKKTGVRIGMLCPGVTNTALVTNIKDKILDIVDSSLLEGFKNSQSQSTDNAASAMLKLISKGKNGAIWITENDQPPYAVKIPHYSKHTAPI